MEPLLPVQVSPELRAATRAMVERLGAWGSTHVVAADGWAPFADALGVPVDEPPSPDDAVAVGVGPIAVTIDRLRSARALGVVGFIAPAAIRRRWWQREPTVFLDPTMQLWDAGWSPLGVERIDVPAAGSTIEVVIGHARPTPERMSALDDAH